MWLTREMKFALGFVVVTTIMARVVASAPLAETFPHPAVASRAPTRRSMACFG